MINNLKKNDEIVTGGGIHGTIVNIKEKTVVVRIDDNVKIEIDRTAVARVEKRIE
jgi:preprotein translocase subunit YajC